MSVPRSGGIAPNRARIPKKWSDLMLANYYADNVVPNISNSQYEGDISGIGDTVIIQKRFSVSTFDYVVGQGLQKQQTMADDSVQLSIDYAHYINVPLNDLDRHQAMGNWNPEVFEEGSRALGTRIEQNVLQTIYSSAGKTITASTAGYTGSDKPFISYILQAAMELNLRNVPDDGLRWLVVDPMGAYMLGLGDLKAAYLTGDGSTPLRSGTAVDKPIAGFNVYISNNLLFNYAGKTCKVLCGHIDALTFAANFTENEVLRDQDDFGDVLRELVCYGYKVVKPEALICLDTSYGSLN